ncbi:Gar1/Naf1 RNA binding region, partial [Rhizoctonia solani]
MDAGTPIQDDLLLIMQSYVDVLPQPPPPVKGEQQQSPTKPVAEHEDSDEDEVELAIQLEPSEEDEGAGSSKGIQNDNAVSSMVARVDRDDSDSDSDSSDSSSDVEMRVTKYPAKKQSTLQQVPGDSDAEDDEDGPSGSIAQYAGTKNEVLLPEVKTPELTVVPPEDILELIGEVMTIIDSVVVVKGYASGVDRVLDTDSLLAFEDRNVFGVVFETFGAVKQPLYSVRFPSASAISKNIVWVGKQVFHVPARSNFVFTREIARIKGSDASNLHDEEVGEDQLDFSDDEAEAQWRRNRSARSPLPHPGVVKEAKRGQATSSGSTGNAVHDTTPKPPKPQLPGLLPYPAADDGDVPYSALPYDNVPDPRPAPAAYDPYFEHEGEAPPMSTGSFAQVKTESEPSGSRGRGRAKDQGRRRGSPNQNRNERRPDDQGRPKRGRGGRGRGRGDRRQGRGGGNFSNQYSREYYPDPSSMMYAMANSAEQYPSATHDEGYNPVNGSNGYWDPSAMPHINPRFFSGEMGADANGGFGMQWPHNQGYNYGYQQPGYGYGGHDLGNQSYGQPPFWTQGEHSYPPGNSSHKQ